MHNSNIPIENTNLIPASTVLVAISYVEPHSLTCSPVDHGSHREGDMDGVVFASSSSSSAADLPTCLALFFTFIHSLLLVFSRACRQQYPGCTTLRLSDRLPQHCLSWSYQNLAMVTVKVELCRDLRIAAHGINAEWRLFDPSLSILRGFLIVMAVARHEDQDSGCRYALKEELSFERVVQRKLTYEVVSLGCACSRIVEICSMI